MNSRKGSSSSPSASRRATTRAMYGLPWALVGVTIVSVLCHQSDGIAYALEDRSRLDTPDASTLEAWRPITGHVVHGNLAHLIYNLALLVPLLFWRERRVGSRRTILEYLLFAVSVALGVRLLHDGWTSYRGLSGVAYGFLALFLLHASRDVNTADGSKRWRAMPLLVLGVITAKTLIEYAAGGWVIGPAGARESLCIVLLPGSHLAGLIAATMLFATESVQRRLAELDHGAARLRAELAGSSAFKSAPITATPEAPERRSSLTRSSRTPPSA